jgi:hypothetical protein
METTSKTRTLRAYVSELLEHPRWIIAHEVDFTGCPYDGHYNAYLPECVSCQFGPGCRWLDRQRTPDTAAAPLHELIEALSSAIEYLQSRNPEEGDYYEETYAWLREARSFLRSHPE